MNLNLHGMANPVIQSVLENINVTLKRYSGIVQNDYFERVPSYNTSTVSMSVQALSSEQLRTMNNLNIQGEMYSVISPIELRGASRVDALGGDILTFKNADWLVVHIDETYPDHCKAVVQKQLTQPALVNHAPVAIDLNYTIEVGQTLSGDLVVDGCTDADSDLLIITMINQAYITGAITLTHGDLTIAQSGAFSYLADSTGIDSFSYTVSDGKGGTAMGNVTITVTEAIAP